MKWNISKITISLVTRFYHLIKFSIYFTLTNIFLILSILIFKINFNNFILFLLPISVLILTLETMIITLLNKNISVTFSELILKTFSLNKEKIFRNIVALILVVLFIIDIHVVINIVGNILLLIPLTITFLFLLNAYLYTLIGIDINATTTLSFVSIYKEAIIMSYIKPLIMIKNSFILIVSIYIFVKLPIFFSLFLSLPVIMLINRNLQMKNHIKGVKNDITSRSKTESKENC